MRRLTLLFIFLLLVRRATAVSVGDSLAQVLTEKGKAVGEMNAGPTKILSYADQTIKLKAGKVVEISDAPPPVPVPDAGASGIGPKSLTPAKHSTFTKPGEWAVDCREALAQAKQEKRRVLLLFTGSDWSAFSQQFHKEIISSPEFARYATDKLVLVMLDFPKTLAQSPALKSQNEALMKAFKVDHLPTVVVLDSEGKPLGKLPFEKGGASAFVDSIKKL